MPATSARVGTSRPRRLPSSAYLRSWPPARSANWRSKTPPGPSLAGGASVTRPDPTAPTLSLLGFVAIRLGDDLHQVAVRVIEIDPAAAVAMVDLAGPLAAGRCVVLDPAVTDPRERRVELRLADQKGIVLRPEILPLGEIEGDPVAGPHRCEMAPFRSGFQVQDVGEELRGDPFIPRRDD